MPGITIQDNRVQEQRTPYTLEDCVYYIDFIREILTDEVHERLTASIYYATRGRLTLRWEGITEEQRHAATLLYEHNLSILRDFTTRLIRDIKEYSRTVDE